MENDQSLLQACTGVDVVYLILPTLVGDAETVMFNNFVQAAKDKNVKHVVYLSAVDAVPEDHAAFKPIHIHGENEQKLRRSGIPFVALRPAWFHENQVQFILFFSFLSSGDSLAFLLLFHGLKSNPGSLDALFILIYR